MPFSAHFGSLLVIWRVCVVSWDGNLPFCPTTLLPQCPQVQQYEPLHFARQNIALNPRNMWAILRNVVDTCVKLEEGKYVLLKDPNKQMIHLYSVPAEADEDEEEEEGEEAAPAEGAA